MEINKKVGLCTFLQSEIGLFGSPNIRSAFLVFQFMLCETILLEFSRHNAIGFM